MRLKNPVICGSGEHVIEAAGVISAIAAGAGAVVVKSVNESEAARRQLAHSDYALLDSRWRRLEWNFDPPPDATLFNRSGLHPGTLEAWLEMTASLVSEQGDSVVVPSIIPDDYSRAPALAARVVSQTNCNVLEVNIGAPHGREAEPGALTLETSREGVTRLTTTIRDAVDVPLWIKLAGQSDEVSGLARAAFGGGADAVTLMTRYMGFVPDVERQEPLLGTMGAIGGAWALPLTCRWLALARDLVGPDRSLIGTNGARTGLDVVRFLLAGACAVQMTSAVFTGGFGVLTDAINEFDHYLADNNDTAAGIVGRAADKLTGYTDQPSNIDHWRRFAPD